MAELNDAVSLEQLKPQKKTNGVTPVESSTVNALVEPRVRHSQAIAALLSERSIERAANACGVSASAMHRWLRDPAFGEAYAKSREAVLDAAIGRLRNACNEAVSTCLEIMSDNTASRPEKLAAARTVLEFAFKDHAGK